MAWVKLADEFPDNPKIQGLSDRAFRYYVTSLCYSSRHLTDGALNKKTAQIVSISAENPRPKQTIEELERAGLLVRNGTGWRIHDYTEYNPTAAQIKEERRKANERMQRWRARRFGVSHNVGDAVTSGEVTGAPSPYRDKSLQERDGVTCPICGVERPSEQSLTDHLANVHDEPAATHDQEQQ